MNDLENLLNLDGEVFPMDSGYWVKFDVKRVGVSISIPHGIKYSLSLHNKRNNRVVGYDNAHMSLNQLHNFLRIFGKVWSTIWRTTNENKNYQSRYYATSTVQTTNYSYCKR